MSRKSNISITALNALTTMALALPGIQTTRGETALTKPQTDFRFTRIDEGKNHYVINVYMAELGLPLSPKMDMTLRANQDVMTGSSSYEYEPEIFRQPGGSPSKLVASARSGQSIQNKRSAGNLNVRYFGDEYRVGVGGSLSEENFYESQTLKLSLTNEFNKGNTELDWGYSVSNDSLKPTLSANDAFRPYQRPSKRQGKVSQKFSFELKQDVTPKSLVQAGVEFIADKGYLSDPYKIFFVYGNPNRADYDGKGQTEVPPGLPFNPFPVSVYVVLDKRPDYRGALATNAKFIQYISPLNSSVHVGYRFVQNTWDLKSHTFTIAYYQDLEDSWQVVPSFRYYSQGEAYFYAMAFDALGTAPFPAKRLGSTGPASSDYRLGKFGALTSELKVHYKFMEDKSAKLTLVFGYINRRNQFYLGKKPYPFNPDNDFKTYYGSLGMTYVF